MTGVAQSQARAEWHVSTGGCKGRVPLVNPFSGEHETVRLDDRVPALQRAAIWNGCFEADLLLQCVGHLGGRALKVWKLLSEDRKSIFCTTVNTLREGLDPGGWMLAVQDFHHAALKG